MVAGCTGEWSGRCSLFGLCPLCSFSLALQRPFPGLPRRLEEHAGGPGRGAGAASLRGLVPEPGRRRDAGRNAPGMFPWAPGGSGESRGGASGAGLSRYLACSGRESEPRGRGQSHRGSRTGGGHAPGRRALLLQETSSGSSLSGKEKRTPYNSGVVYKFRRIG